MKHLEQLPAGTLSRRLKFEQRWLSMFTDPILLWLSSAFAVSGMVQLVSGAAPNSVASELPPAIVYAWSVLLVLSGSMVFYGLVVQSPAIERLGLGPLAVGASVYGFMILTQAWPRGVLPGLLLLWFAFACLAKRYKVTNAIYVTEFSAARTSDAMSQGEEGG